MNTCGHHTALLLHISYAHTANIVRGSDLVYTAGGLVSSRERSNGRRSPARGGASGGQRNG